MRAGSLALSRYLLFHELISSPFIGLLV